MRDYHRFPLGEVKGTLDRTAEFRGGRTAAAFADPVLLNLITAETLPAYDYRDWMRDGRDYDPEYPAYARGRYYETGYELRGDVVALQGDQAVLCDDPLEPHALAKLCADLALDSKTWPKVETPEGDHYFLTPADAATVSAAIA